MTNHKIRSPFPWFGGKGNPKIKQLILDNLPPHTRYIEPFGGGGSILISKEPAEVEVYNDVDRGVVGFFRVIADVDYFSKFLARASLMPYSRELYEECARTWPAIHDPVEQAVRWFYVARQSFSGVFGNSWGTGVTTNPTAAWINSFRNLPEVHKRIQNVQIECSDWRDVLSRFAGPGWLAYCDPPYVAGARKAGGYAHELRDTDHAELVETLLRYDGARAPLRLRQRHLRSSGSRRLGSRGGRRRLLRRRPHARIGLAGSRIRPRQAAPPGGLVAQSRDPPPSRTVI